MPSGLNWEAKERDLNESRCLIPLSMMRGHQLCLPS